MRTETQWNEVVSQIRGIVEGEDNLVANLANAAAVLKMHFDWWWIGFYLVNEERNELILGPFQGPPACVHIPYGKGVCGTAWAREETIVVPDVEEFPGHIACSSASRSEIVVPMFRADGKCWGEIDIDSVNLDEFDAADARYLELIAEIISASTKPTQ